MPLVLPKPIIYPLTSGTTTSRTTANDPQFLNILRLLEAAVAAEVPLFQIREKSLSARVLFELTVRAASLTSGTGTRLLVNDRADVAREGGADGVHLTTTSLPAAVVREKFGSGFLIGVSTHLREEVRAAQSSGADFAVFGPVFDTESKRIFGEPKGLEKLREVTAEAGDFPVVAIGGITLDNVAECFAAGASGIAAIRLFSDSERLSSIVEVIKKKWK
jgi:thiamine-phosphate pyrophosphorylase